MALVANISLSADEPKTAPHNAHSASAKKSMCSAWSNSSKSSKPSIESSPNRTPISTARTISSSAKPNSCAANSSSSSHRENSHCWASWSQRCSTPLAPTPYSWSLGRAIKSVCGEIIEESTPSCCSSAFPPKSYGFCGAWVFLKRLIVDTKSRRFL